MKRTTSLARRAVQYLLTIAVGLALFTVVGFVIVPRLLGWHPVVVLSGSMEPGIRVGDLVFLAPVRPADVKVGDVISYREARNVRVTHRVVAVVTGETGALAFQTKGDANNEPDAGVVQASQVDSREVVTVPYGGKIVDFFHSPNGFFGLVLVPGLVVIGLSLANIFTELSKRRGQSAAPAP